MSLGWIENYEGRKEYRNQVWMMRGVRGVIFKIIEKNPIELFEVLVGEYNNFKDSAVISKFGR